ncbi:Hypothetical protein A7982_02255 [Minicystis rosea]|nr:Hypothetical protein A7982_02255 [Minicystis rosea]
MTFTDAAAEVLRLVGRPLHYKEITDIAIEKNLLSHVGKSPEVTMGARLAATLKKDSPENPLVRVKPGVFALREWDDKTIKAGLDAKKGKKPARPEPEPTAVTEQVKDEDDEVLIGGEDEEPEEAPVEEAELEEPAEEAEVHAEPAVAVIEEEPAPASPPQPAPSVPMAARSRPARVELDEDEDAEPPGPDDVMRAEAAAGAAEMFDEEEDDDQPILGGGDDRAAPQGGEQGEGRRRRRRRRRGRTNGEPAPSGGGLPTYTATPAFSPRDSRDGRDGRDGRDARDSGRESGGRDRDREPSYSERRNDMAPAEAPYRPQVIELTGGEGHALDDLAGRELGDAVAVILSTFDRNAGAVSLRQIAETAQRRGRLAGDVQLVQSQIAAAVRADNARRIAAGQRPRFRFAGGRVALTDWLLSGDLARLEAEALAAVERYRDAARRSFARKLGELPGHAFVELCVLALEKVGVSQIRALRRPGAPGGESHFTGILRAASADELRIGIVIRRDGREIGRERVSDLRGSLHHYGPANAGWILTAGQTLSGAREEASVPGTAPIALFDGLAVARLCEENDVAVIRARLPVAIPDVDLLEALRAS